MPHIHDQPGQVDTVVNAYIFLKTDEGPKVLLHRHRKLPVLLPCGGHVELDETPWAAIAHELTEEMGYTLAELDVLQPQKRIQGSAGMVMHPVPIIMNTHRIPNLQEHYHTETGYLFLAHAEPQGMPDVGESQELRWYTRNEVANLPSEDIWQHVRTVLLEMFDDFLHYWVAVPATTCSIAKPGERTKH
jgi:8-oxo-dGTP pyrophosphatase MutT (NUDIX family)